MFITFMGHLSGTDCSRSTNVCLPSTPRPRHSNKGSTSVNIPLAHMVLCQEQKEQQLFSSPLNGSRDFLYTKGVVMEWKLNMR